MDFELADVIADVESNNRPEAMRYEPLLHQRGIPAPLIDIIKQANHCTMETAAVIASCSWGMYQILGLNLYDPKLSLWTGSVISYAGNRGAQRASFMLFNVRRCGGATLQQIIDDPAVRTNFITHYNGPGNVDGYWALMKTSIVRLGGEVVTA